MYKIPILITLFNRPDHTEKLINTLNELSVNKIYIFVDGARPNNLQDKTKCQNVIEKIDKINNHCDIKKKISNVNLGCKEAVSTALEWFFSNEKYGVILEDDCIPSEDFLNFCEWALIKYETEISVGGITGNNFLKNDTFINDSFYFSKYAHCWGWATWQRVWSDYDKNIKFWKNFKTTNEWKNLFKNNIEKRYWAKIFNKVFNNKIDSWAYPWTLCLWKCNKLIITPKVNLVTNIGFDTEATRTYNIGEKFDYNVSKLSKPYIEPLKIEVNNDADKYVFKNHFKGKNFLWPYRIYYILKFFLTSPMNFFRKLTKLILN